MSLTTDKNLAITCCQTPHNPETLSRAMFGYKKEHFSASWPFFAWESGIMHPCFLRPRKWPGTFSRAKSTFGCVTDNLRNMTIKEHARRNVTIIFTQKMTKGVFWVWNIWLRWPLGFCHDTVTYSTHLPKNITVIVPSPWPFGWAVGLKMYPKCHFWEPLFCPFGSNIIWMKTRAGSLFLRSWNGKIL